MSNDLRPSRPFGMADKLGYMFGDFGNDFTFLLSSGFMMKFYTDVMGIAPGVVGALMMLARFVDAFTDVGMGQIVDRARATPEGRFRPWIRRMCIPVAAASFLIYQAGLSGAPYWLRVVWMFGTYILWGSFFYTAINIPYGSMASTITPEPDQRTQLSTWRTIGSTLANLVIGTGTPLVAYVVVDGKSVLSGPRMTVIAGIFSVLAVVCYALCYNLVEERVVLESRREKLDVGGILRSLARNRALLGIIVAAVFILLAMLSMTGMSNYVFPNYYGNVQAQSFAALAGSVVMLAVCAPTAGRLAKRFGKKELAITACLFSAGVYLLCFLVRPATAYGYVAFFTLAYVGMGYFNTIIWAMITDVIDDAEVRSGKREDGTIYAVYSFARKTGQALSSGMTGGLLGLIGYSDATAFDPAVTNSIFAIACWAPTIGFVIVALSLLLIYPLDRRRVEANAAELRRRREQ